MHQFGDLHYQRKSLKILINGRIREFKSFEFYSHYQSLRKYNQYQQNTDKKPAGQIHND